MPKVLYWAGLIQHRVGELLEDEEVKSLVDNLLSGNTREADLDLKKAKGYRLYTAKLNRSNRLLFTTIEVGEKPYLLLLEKIENHNYQKSRFLNSPSLLRDYLEKNAELLHAL